MFSNLIIRVKNFVIHTDHHYFSYLKIHFHTILYIHTHPPSLIFEQGLPLRTELLEVLEGREAIFDPGGGAFVL